MSWEEARSRCEALGAGLAMIETDGELAALRSYRPLLLSGQTLWTAGRPCGPSPGGFCWRDGVAVTQRYETGVWMRNGQGGARTPVFLADGLLCANGEFLRGGGASGYLCEWPSGPGALVLRYDGPAFTGSPFVFVTLVRGDGTELPMRLGAQQYGGLSDCAACSANGPAPSPASPVLPDGPPPQRWQSATVLRYEGDGLRRDVVGRCPRGGECIAHEAVASGEYQLRVTGAFRCAGSVQMPLVGERVFRCAR